MRVSVREAVDDAALSRLHASAFGGPYRSHEAGGAGCTWLHVDFEQHLTRFHVDTCGFRTTAAGMLHLLGGDLLAARVEPGLTALGRARRRPPPLVLFP